MLGESHTWSPSRTVNWWHNFAAAMSRRKMADVAKRLNPKIEIVLLSHDEDEARLFEKEALGKVFVGEHELALGITQHILERMGMHSSDKQGASR